MITANPVREMRFVLVIVSLLTSARLLGAEGQPPTIFNTLSSHGDRIVGSGVPVGWSVTAASTTPLTYQWHQNGNPLLGATNRFLTLNEVQMSEAGVYTVQVANEFGSVTSNAGTLTVVPGLDLRRIGQITISGWVYSFDVVANLAYVGVDSGASSSEGGGVRIFDVSDPSAPVLIGGVALAAARQVVSISDVVVSGERVYVAAASRGFFIIDASDPVTPFILGHFDTANNALDLVIRGSIAYVATSRGVEVLDISVPQQITRIGSYSTDQAVYTLDLNGETLYVAATSEGIHVLDVSDPATPRGITSFKPGISVDTVKVRDRRLFCSGYRGPSVYDVTDPQFPLTLAADNATADSRGMAVAKHFILDGSSRWITPGTYLIAFDAANPRQLIPVAVVPTTGTVEAIEVRDNRVFVAATGGGVDIFEFGVATDPPFVLMPPLPIQAVLGTDAEFDTHVVGGLNLRFQWFKDGESLPGGTNQTFRIEAVASRDTGEYSVSVENEAGTVMAGTARLDIIDAVSLSLQSVLIGDIRGPRPTFAAPDGVQAEIWGTANLVDWQPVWFGRFDGLPFEIIDTTGPAAFRVYRLRHGAR